MNLCMTVHVIIEPLSISVATDSVEDDVLIGSIFIGIIALLVMIIIITVTVMCIINYKRCYDCSIAFLHCIYYPIVYRYCQEKILSRNFDQHTKIWSVLFEKRTWISFVIL